MARANSRGQSTVELMVAMLFLFLMLLLFFGSLVTDTKKELSNVQLSKELR
jgi:hypothetical protein